MAICLQLQGHEDEPKQSVDNQPFTSKNVVTGKEDILLTENSLKSDDSTPGKQ